MSVLKERVLSDPGDGDDDEEEEEEELENRQVYVCTYFVLICIFYCFHYYSDHYANCGF